MSEDTFATTEVLIALSRLFDTGSWESRFHVLEQEQTILLSPQADQILLSLIERRKREEATAQEIEFLKTHHMLLERIHMLGWPCAWEYFSKISIDDERSFAISTFYDFLAYDNINDIKNVFEQKRILLLSDGYALDRYPLLWATLQNSLGEIYRNRISGIRPENLEQAVKHCQNALQVHTHTTFPIGWAFIQAMLGEVYSELGFNTSEKQSVLEQALKHYQGAMQILTEETFPAQWAIVQQGLSAVYFMRISGEKTENLQEAIVRGQSALRVLTRTTYPFEWAGAHTHLGEAYRQAALYANLQELYSGRPVMQEQAIRHLEAALQVYTQHDYPLGWAKVRHFQGLVYLERVQGKRNENLVQARNCFEAALQVFNREFSSYEVSECTKKPLQVIPQHIPMLIQSIGEDFRLQDDYYPAI